MSQSKLLQLMNEELPSINKQKKKVYRTDKKEVKKLFNIINSELFNGKLNTPKIDVKIRIPDCWALCKGISNPTKNKSGCEIVITQNHFCIQWLITVIAHEMAHQYQWDIIGLQRIKKGLNPIMSHGPTFYIHRKKFNKYKIPLKRIIHNRIWFVKQNLLKC